jgi:hypothetical protein
VGGVADPAAAGEGEKFEAAGRDASAENVFNAQYRGMFRVRLASTTCPRTETAASFRLAFMLECLIAIGRFGTGLAIKGCRRYSIMRACSCQ